MLWKVGALPSVQSSASPAQPYSSREQCLKAQR